MRNAYLGGLLFYKTLLFLFPIDSGVRKMIPGLWIVHLLFTVCLHDLYPFSIASGQEKASPLNAVQMVA